jgi:NAD(P)-dependent dehydrogenase (short-subunit alcohol dehydrogenase family)
MVLVGSSPHPGNKPESGSSSDITVVLKKFSAEGLFCRYYSCDITDINSLNLLIERVRHEVGPITGVIHGAGLNRPNRTENVSSEEALKEIGPKLYGAMNLCDVLKDAPPKLFVGFTSIIGVTGMPGNAWYAFSNEALDVVLRKFERENPTSSVLCIAFSIWEEIGMGARLGSVQHLAKMGIGAIPTSEGVHRFLNLVLDNIEVRQVIVTARLGGFEVLGGYCSY